jgi:hypothetical protein
MRTGCDVGCVGLCQAAVQCLHAVVCSTCEYAAAALLICSPACAGCSLQSANRGVLALWLRVINRVGYMQGWYPSLHRVKPSLVHLGAVCTSSFHAGVK